MSLQIIKAAFQINSCDSNRIRNYRINNDGKRIRDLNWNLVLMSHHARIWPLNHNSIFKTQPYLSRNETCILADTFVGNNNGTRATQYIYMYSNGTISVDHSWDGCVSVNFSRWDGICKARGFRVVLPGMILNLCIVKEYAGLHTLSKLFIRGPPSDSAFGSFHTPRPRS